MLIVRVRSSQDGSWVTTDKIDLCEYLTHPQAVVELIDFQRYSSGISCPASDTGEGTRRRPALSLVPDAPNALQVESTDLSGRVQPKPG